MNTTSNSLSSSNAGDDGDVCTHYSKALVLIPHRIPVTCIAAVTLSCMLAGSIFLMCQRKTFIFRRKAAQYLALATMGLMFYIRDSLAIVWTYPAYDCADANYLLYYLVAVPIHFIPVMLRNWRIYCIYRETPNWNCSTDSMLSAKTRRHKWMWLRIVILYIPFALVAPFINVSGEDSQNITYYLWISIEGFYCLLNICLSIRLLFMRSELKEKFIDETKSLLVYAVIAFVEVAYSNTMYITATDSRNDFIVAYVYGDLILVSLMWFMTGGKAILQIGKRKGARESQYKADVGKLSQESIAKAKQMVEMAPTTPKNELAVSITPSSSDSYIVGDEPAPPPPV